MLRFREETRVGLVAVLASLLALGGLGWPWCRCDSADHAGHGHAAAGHVDHAGHDAGGGHAEHGRRHHRPGLPQDPDGDCPCVHTGVAPGKPVQGERRPGGPDSDTAALPAAPVRPAAPPAAAPWVTDPRPSGGAGGPRLFLLHCRFVC